MAKKDVTPPQYRFGWTPFKNRTPDIHKAYDEFCASLPDFKIINRTSSGDGKRMFLWDFCKAVNGGKHLKTTRQLVGSCVGHGLYNACRILMCVDIAMRGEFEKFTELFEPYGYGRSRYHSGIRGRGEGSTGAGAAKAAMADGVLKRHGLSGWNESDDTITWDGNTDLSWSDGAKIDSKYIEEGRTHLVKSVAMVTSYEQVRDAILNGYPVAGGSNQGFTMTPKIEGDKAWGRAQGQWSHMLSMIAVDDDPKRPGVYIWNSWGADAHGSPVGGACAGGFWADADVITRMCRGQDYFAYGNLDGFPEQKLDKALFKLINKK